ncbi:MAG: Fimbrial assembly family protein [Candidatus Saccharibacteria bacterium]|nr:Fimbrial assembly family protein [Candidatus Saccharibacteria bacterium]
MINLLPQEEKKQIKAARMNVLLLRYNLLVGGAVLFLVGIIALGTFYLVTAEKSAETSIVENSMREGTYAEIKTEADNFRSELANSKAILDGQVSYAKAALNIASLLPDGTALNELKLNEQSFSSPLVMTVNIANEQAAINLINNFKNSRLFSNVTKGKISIGTGTYPYVMELTVNMSKEAAQ